MILLLIVCLTQLYLSIKYDWRENDRPTATVIWALMWFGVPYLLTWEAP